MKKAILLILRGAAVSTLAIAIFLAVSDYKIVSNEATAQCVPITSTISQTAAVRGINSATAFCPGGTRAISGAWQYTGCGDVDYVWVKKSRPTPGLDGWYIEVNSNGAGCEILDVTAICL